MASAFIHGVGESGVYEEAGEVLVVEVLAEGHLWREARLAKHARETGVHLREWEGNEARAPRPRAFAGDEFIAR